MTAKLIDVQESLEAWRREPAYQAAYLELEEEFALARALIEARSEANLSQTEIALRMQTSQPAIARLEGGHSNPSLKTLRRYAAATGKRVRIVFEPCPPVDPSLSSV
jgi:DNA-binding XRE family transcriptional regulator